VDPQPETAAGFLDHRDSVVEVLRGLAIDGDRRRVVEAGSLLALGDRHALGQLLGRGEDVLRERFDQFILSRDDADIHAAIVEAAQHLEHLDGFFATAGERRDDLDLDDIAPARTLAEPRQHGERFAERRIERLNPAIAEMHREQLFVRPVHDVDDAPEAAAITPQAQADFDAVPGSRAVQTAGRDLHRCRPIVGHDLGPPTTLPQDSHDRPTPRLCGRLEPPAPAARDFARLE